MDIQYLRELRGLECDVTRLVETYKTGSLDQYNINDSAQCNKFGREDKFYAA